MKKILALILSIILCFLLVSCNKALPTDQPEESSTDTETTTDTDSPEDLTTHPTALFVKDGKLDFPKGVPEYVEIEEWEFSSTPSPTIEIEYRIQYYSKAVAITNFFKNMDLTPMGPEEVENMNKYSGNNPFRIIFCYKDGSKVYLGYDSSTICCISLSGEYYDTSAYNKELRKLLAVP